MSHTVSSIHDHCINLERREIFLHSDPNYTVGALEDDGDVGIEHLFAARFIKNLKLLEARSDKPITIHMISSTGGSLDYGLAIYDAMRASPCHLTVINWSHAASMGAAILQGADTRVMAPNSFLMYHKGITSSGEMSPDAAQSFLQLTQRQDEMYLDILAQKIFTTKTNNTKSLKQIKRQLQNEMQKKIDVYLSAEESVREGLADTILGRDGHVS